MKYILLLIFTLTGYFARAQYRCMKFCFYIYNENGSIEDEIIHQSDLQTVRFQFEFLNCGSKSIFIDTLPGIGNDYSNWSMFNNFGTSSLIMNIGSKHYIYSPFFNERLDSGLVGVIAKDSSKMKLLRPGLKFKTKKGSISNCLRSLPVGSYEVSFDYIDEANHGLRRIPSSNVTDSAMIAKYFGKKENFSDGFYIQHSKNKIRFTVIE